MMKFALGIEVMVSVFGPEEDVWTDEEGKRSRDERDRGRESRRGRRVVGKGSRNRGSEPAISRVETAECLCVKLTCTHVDYWRK